MSARTVDAYGALYCTRAKVFSWLYLKDRIAYTTCLLYIQDSKKSSVGRQRYTVDGQYVLCIQPR